MTHVANILEINVSTLTTTINKLVKKGYVERLRDDKDRRIVKIGLSEKRYCGSNGAGFLHGRTASWCCGAGGA